MRLWLTAMLITGRAWPEACQKVHAGAPNSRTAAEPCPAPRHQRRRDGGSTGPWLGRGRRARPVACQGDVTVLPAFAHADVRGGEGQGTRRSASPRARAKTATNPRCASTHALPLARLCTVALRRRGLTRVRWAAFAGGRRLEWSSKRDEDAWLERRRVLPL
eukprot:362938-Chlamydomonas_euryale.AAC.11